MRTVLIIALMCLALASCRTLSAAGSPEAPTPSQGTAAVEATVSSPDR